MEIRVKPPGNQFALVDSANEVCEELGLAEVPNECINSMRRLGIRVQQAGVINTDVGFSYLTKVAIIEAVEENRLKIKGASAEALTDISNNLAKLARAVGSLSGKNSPTDGPPAAPKAPTRSFAPGQAAAFHVHYHQEKK